MRALALAFALAVAAASVAAAPAVPEWTLHARVVAVNLPAVHGVRQVGRFHFGGPIPGNPEFLLHTQAGRVLDPLRVLVALGDNLGAGRAQPDHAAGAVVSIDATRAQTIVVPGDLARAGGSGSAHDGAVQLYTAQSGAFTNARHNAGARTASFTAAAGPRYLSINNAFGRPWIANAPLGARGAGSLSVVDPDGTPLANPPSAAAGGVFAGALTTRDSQPRAVRTGLRATWFNQRPSAPFTPGALATGVLGTAFLGPSPDGTGFAVFAAATADGALVQAHVQGGVDGLAPPGTIDTRGHDAGVLGMAFKWNPLPALYVADPLRDRVLLVHLRHDDRHFVVHRVDAIEHAAFAKPTDLAPAVPEVANPRFSSHTTLAGGSDLYVANRGDGSVLRIDERGRVLARLQVVLPGQGVIGPGRIRAIAVSADAQHIWLTLAGPAPGHERHEGALVELPAFDAQGPFRSARPHATASPSSTTARADAGDAAVDAAEGQRLFAKSFEPSEGLGPLFNARSCLTCHSHPSAGGMSITDEHFARRVARIDPTSGRTRAVDHPNSPVARRHLVADTPGRPSRGSGPSVVDAEFPREANLVSLRMPPALYPIARIDEIADEAIAAGAVARGDGIKGRAHRVVGPDGSSRVGRYGWKASAATLEQMVAEAFANELGIRSALHVAPDARDTRDAFDTPAEDGATAVRAVAAYLRALEVPRGTKP